MYRCDPAQTKAVTEKRHRYVAAEFLNIPSFHYKIIEYGEELRLDCACRKIHLFRGALARALQADLSKN
jgi:hypothetical protein